MRVLVTGLGGHLGTRVAQILERDTGVDRIVGFDLDPPRHMLERTEFVRCDPRDRRRVGRVVEELRPTHVAHLGVYEPNARTSPSSAERRTYLGTVAALGAAAEAGELLRIVLRSGTEVYGRRRGAPIRPNESVPPDPTSPFGRTLVRVEGVAADAAAACDATALALRCAPIVGPHVPSPLGRLVRLPVVPVALGDPAFSLVHRDDVADAVVASLRADRAGPLNLSGPGATTMSKSARMGGGVPVGIAPPAWPVVRGLCEFAGAPIPAHVLELLRRGRSADSSAAADALGVEPQPTEAIVAALHDWASVTILKTGSLAA